MRSSPQHRALLFALIAGIIGSPGLARADLGDNSLGMNTHVPANDLLDMCVDLGTPWIRVDANWWAMNPSDGTYQWTEMDRVVDQASSRGLQVFMTLAYTPEWVPKVSRARDDSYTGNDEPATSTEWVAFVDAAVTRYRARGVTHFGIWNEANLDGFWESEAGVDAWIDKILVPGADAVRSACGDCLVLGPDLAHVGDYDVFMDRVLERAIDAFDIIAHHNYHGWPETGTTLFDGDNFLQALEMRRFTFSRISLRELLDEHGWTGEVWITETGERVTPGDAAAEDEQAVYVRRVMEEQLARSWWTNTFFYEITDCGVDDPSCPIDGFGITRPTAALPRSFPGDYRLKPSYLEIRGFIEDHPEIVSSAPPAECGDGVDNDGDGRVDSEDRGCEGGVDDDESDDPPRRALEALPVPAGGIDVDGDLGEWGLDGGLLLGRADWQGTEPWGGSSDLFVRAMARWEDGALYLAFEVVDDVHVNDDDETLLWQSDSLQIAFDVSRNYGDAYDDTDDHEINAALSAMITKLHRFHGPAGATNVWEAAIARSGTTTSYELRLDEDVLAPADLVEGTTIGFSFLVNDDDGEDTTDGTGREGWLEMTPGIGTRKSPYDFGELRLVRTATRPDAGAGVDAGIAVDGGGTGTDGGTGADGGGDDGCGCVAAGAAPDAPHSAWAAVLLLLVVGRLSTAARRRARRTTSRSADGPRPRAG